ncbi:response regulator [Halomonas sp. EGI 63088]|uniref:Response regulator n=1 Tax=Halomonas flagellata TaxID=2920385 RepID=A0ABS9RXW8_9GAMM|nr:response regulator [Halomonas flagellata]MCH4564630.1 response regulator [Halomonas flagellata]
MTNPIPVTHQTRYHIAVVDDEVDMLDVLQDALQDEGYRVSALRSGQALHELIARDPVDLIVLDLKLAGENGLQVARDIRATSPVPIMMLTGKGDETDRILGLEVAADDFLMKPFNLRELMARVHALLRRSKQLSVPLQSVEDQDHACLWFDDWRLDLTRRMLYNPANQPVNLTFGEFNLLESLVSSANHVLSRDSLLERTRGTDSDSFDRSIDVLILRLRRKLEANPKHPRYILTERGQGYVFHAQVRKR